MMRIAHRGNTEGRKPELENSPDYIFEAMRKGYGSEVDVWITNNGLMIGHDKSLYKSNIYELGVKIGIARVKCLIYFHCKDLETYLYFKDNMEGYKYFYQDNDLISVVSNGELWAHPNCENVRGCIMLDLEDMPTKAIKHYEAIGICKDNFNE